MTESYKILHLNIPKYFQSILKIKKTSVSKFYQGNGC
jgi:hypothetical protein